MTKLSGLSQLPYSLSHFIEFYSTFFYYKLGKKTTEASAKRDKDIMYG